MRSNERRLKLALSLALNVTPPFLPPSLPPSLNIYLPNYLRWCIPSIPFLIYPSLIPSFLPHLPSFTNLSHLSRSTSAASLSFFVCTSRIAFLPSLSGRGHCTIRSNRPDRRRAGSSSSNLRRRREREWEEVRGEEWERVKERSVREEVRGEENRREDGGKR